MEKLLVIVPALQALCSLLLIFSSFSLPFTVSLWLWRVFDSYFHFVIGPRVSGVFVQPCLWTCSNYLKPFIWERCYRLMTFHFKGSTTMTWPGLWKKLLSVNIMIQTCCRRVVIQDHISRSAVSDGIHKKSFNFASESPTTITCWPQSQLIGSYSKDLDVVLISADILLYPHLIQSQDSQGRTDLWRCAGTFSFVSYFSIKSSFLFQLNPPQGEKLLCTKSSSFHLYIHWCESVLISVSRAFVLPAESSDTKADDPEWLTLYSHQFSIHLENKLRPELL